MSESSHDLWFLFMSKILYCLVPGTLHENIWNHFLGNFHCMILLLIIQNDEVHLIQFPKFCFWEMWVNYRSNYFVMSNRDQWRNHTNFFWELLLNPHTKPRSAWDLTSWVCLIPNEAMVYLNHIKIILIIGLIKNNEHPLLGQSLFCFYHIIPSSLIPGTYHIGVYD